MKIIFEIDLSQVPAEREPSMRGKLKSLHQYLQRAFCRELMLLDLDHPKVQIGITVEEDPEVTG